MQSLAQPQNPAMPSKTAADHADREKPVAGSVGYSYRFYRRTCGMAAVLDVERLHVVLKIGAVGAITLPVGMVPMLATPMISHPGGRRCTILTRGVPEISDVYRTRLTRYGIAVADPGSGVVLPLWDNDPSSGWQWLTRPPSGPPMLIHPFTVLKILPRL